MEVIQEESEVKVKEESEVKVKEEASDTNIQGQIQIDHILDWKLNRSAECRDTPSLPSMESQVTWSTMDRGQDGTNKSRENAEEFIGDPLQTQTSFTDDQIDIKYEGSGIEYYSTKNAECDQDTNPGPHSIFTNINPKSGSECSVSSGRIELNELYLRLLQYEEDCETCQKYIQELSEHVRATHAAGQPPPDPLHIDPVEMDQPSAIKIKFEGRGERMECSEETETDPDYNTEGDSESDPDYITSPVMTRKVPSDPITRKETLSAHKRSEIKRKGSKIRFQCTECERSFNRKDHLAIHMRSHTGERPFKCRKWEKTFSQKGHFDTHVRSHNGEKPYECKDCRKGFKTNCELTLHVRSHTCEKPFKCTECKKSFSTKCNLTRHMSCHSHTGEKRYECKECRKNFRTKYELTLHMRIHTGEKPFKCTGCRKSFSQKCNLDRHYKRSHAAPGTVPV